MATDPLWIVMPAMSNPAMTEAALSDCLAQTVPVRILLILQGVEAAFRDRCQQIAEQEPRLLVWDHHPPLPSLSATWNRALAFVWACGGTEALVVNNDIRCRPDTVQELSHVRHLTHALFITAVGVTAEQYTPDEGLIFCKDETADDDEMALAKGGPDFSCFLISKAGHEQYPFDENFIPAFCEDLDQHRRYMLGGDGDRIFSINLPYLHLGGGSNTLKSLDTIARASKEATINRGSRAYYQKKWGGPVNAERWTIPFDSQSDQDGVTTPDLQRAVQGDR